MNPLQARDLLDAIAKVTAHWTRQRKAEERNSRAEVRRLDALTRQAKVSIKAAAWEYMERGYLHASDHQRLVATARQVMYSCRKYILERTGEGSLNDEYFTQGLLPDFMDEHPELTADWDVVFDARGSLIEPHTRVRIPLGTLDVRGYLRGQDKRDYCDPYQHGYQFAMDWRTFGPKHRYGAILFCEKETFLPLFEAEGLAERYDLAIMSTKGFSNTASRAVIDALCDADDEAGLPLFVLHDFDIDGLGILNTLYNATRRFKFTHPIRVIDLGLRLRDAEELGLEGEPVIRKGDLKDLVIERGATPAEQEYLVERVRAEKTEGNKTSYTTIGQRVELNALTSAQLMDLITNKLEEHSVKKVIPDAAMLTKAYRRAVALHFMNTQLEALHQAAVKISDEAILPEDLVDQVKAQLAENPEQSWDEAIAELAESIETDDAEVSA